MGGRSKWAIPARGRWHFLAWPLLADPLPVVLSSNLKDIARQIGQIVPDHDFRTGPSVQNVINNMKLHEAWDALEAMKKMVTDDKRGIDTATD